MRAYELMVIVDISVEEAAWGGVVERIREQLLARGATIHRVGRWGRPRFAYELDHKTEGYYVVMELLAEGGALDEVERGLRLADDIVRHKLIRLPDKEAARRGLAPSGAAAASDAG